MLLYRSCNELDTNFREARVGCLTLNSAKGTKQHKGWEVIHERRGMQESTQHCCVDTCIKGWYLMFVHTNNFIIEDYFDIEIHASYDLCTFLS